jgi:hypothetical protein
MKNLFSYFLAFSLLFTFGCVKDDFDAPPSGGDPLDIPADQIVSIDDVLDLMVLGTPKAIGLEKYIYATVVGDDESGNLYKTLVLEDTKSDKGISILIDETDLFNQFPVGRNVYVYLKDLYIGDYNELPQLGYTGGVRIPAGIYSEIVFGDIYGQNVTPRVKKISELSYDDVNTLIQIDKAEFASSSQGMPFSDADFSTNRDITDCDENEILLRTSNFSNFAATTVPSGNGTIIGVLGYFRGDYQLTLRKIEEIDFTGTKCGSTSTGDEVKISIADLKSLYTNGTTTAPEVYIEGTVISDVATQSIHPQNMVIQDGASGIVLRFTGSHTFARNTKVKVILTDKAISEFNGLLQVDGIDVSDAVNLGAGSVTPLEITVNELKVNLENYESTLVKIKDATLSGNTVFSGSVSVTDATGNVVLYTRSASTFANSSVPTGNVDVVAIVSQFNDAQIIIRDANDVEGGNVNPGGDALTIRSLRDAFNGGATSAANGYIEGIVVSDFATENTTTRNLHIQDGTAGIALRFNADHGFPLGTKIKVTTNGIELSEYAGLLQLNNIPNGNASVTGTGTVTPVVLTIAAIKSNLEQYESMVVKIENATIDAGTFTGTININDSTGSIGTFIRSQATFAGSATPSGNHNVTCIVSEFNEAQVTLRNLSDIN